MISLFDESMMQNINLIMITDNPYATS